MCGLSPLEAVYAGTPNTGEIYSVSTDCIPMPGESIPGVECMGRVV